MSILKLEKRYFNFWLLLAYFLVIGLIDSQLFSPILILLAILLSYLFPEKRESGYFLDAIDLGEYSDQYLYALYRAFLSYTYIYLAYSINYQLSLDIVFFIFWCTGGFLYSFAATFVPKDGFKTGGNFKVVQLYAIMYLLVTLLLTYWIIVSFKGLDWFSPLVTNIYHLVIGGL